MEFEFLYDRSRELLAIGYNVAAHRRDAGCYDLLASESRLVSFLLIARGHLPQEHWFSLGRLLTHRDGELVLLSWSGSMFEYLMPELLMPAYPDTLLGETVKAAVATQIAYGAERGTPWGISESCYNAVDAREVYQYRAFGVPGLGFKRGLADDLVIAPYATMLALPVAPAEACRNLETLAANGYLGRYGFYEAIDYTPSRRSPTDAAGDRARLHGPPSRHELGGARQRAARPPHVAPLHGRSRRCARRSRCSKSGCPARG